MTPSHTKSDQVIRAVIYCRISQDRVGSHLGIDRQREDCEALAVSRGWNVVEVYIDNDVSAYSGKKRKGYQKMLADLETGMATVIVVWHTDRLHRSNTELEGYIEFSNRRGVSTYSVQSGELDLATSSGKMNARIVGAVAVHESEHKGERVARARLQKAKAGKWAGGIRPFGWGLPTGESRKKTVRETGEEIEVPVLDMEKKVPAEAAALDYGTDLMLTPEGTVKSWVRWLASKGILSTQGKPIDHQSARDLLLRPRNAGIAVYRGQEIGTGKWDQIIDVPRFRAVVAVLSDPSRVTTPGPAPKWFGSMIYRCGIGDCTKTCRCSLAGGAKRPGYRCTTNHGGGKRADKLDKYIEDLLIERLSRPDAGDLLLPGPEDVDTAALQLESEQIRRRLTDMAGLFASGQMDMSQFATGSDVARSQLEGVTRQLARAATHDPLVGLVGVPDVRKVWKGLELERRRAVLRSLLDVTLHPSRPGRMPDGGYFDYEAVEVDWKR